MHGTKLKKLEQRIIAILEGELLQGKMGEGDRGSTGGAEGGGRKEGDKAEIEEMEPEASSLGSKGGVVASRDKGSQIKLQLAKLLDDRAGGGWCSGKEDSSLRESVAAKTLEGEGVVRRAEKDGEERKEGDEEAQIVRVDTSDSDSDSSSSESFFFLLFYLILILTLLF